MMKKKQKKDNAMLVFTIVTIVVLVLGYFLVRKESPAPALMETQGEVATIENDVDLVNVSQELDNTPIDSIDITLDENDSDVEDL